MNSNKRTDQTIELDRLCLINQINCLEELLMKTLTVARQYLVHFVEKIQRAERCSNLFRIAAQFLLDLLDNVVAGLLKNHVVVAPVNAKSWLELVRFNSIRFFDLRR